MKPETLIAIYAAFVSTVVFVWQVIVKLREGARLRLSTSSNMKMAYVGGGSDDDKYVIVNATNVGSCDTTITHLFVFTFDNWWKRWRRRPSNPYFIINGLEVYRIPYVLEVGRMWTGMAKQTEVVENLSRDHALYAGVYHSFSERPVIVRIKPIQIGKKTDDPEKTFTAPQRDRS